MALKTPFGAINSGYYGPPMVLRRSIIFPKDVPKGQGSRATRNISLAPRSIYKTIIRTSDEDRPLGWFWGMERRSDSNWPRRQSLRYWPRACHSWRSITRSEAFSRSTLAVTSPTGVIGWMTGPFSLKCSSHMSRRGSKNRTGCPKRSTDAISEPLYRLQRTQA